MPLDSTDPHNGCPALSPDGHQLVATALGTLAIWPLQLDVLAGVAREIVGRGLTSPELERYATKPSASLP